MIPSHLVTRVQRLRGALGRYSVPSILGGLWLQRHFASRAPVIWVDGFPAPKVIGEGRIETDGFTITSGARLEVARGTRLTIGKGTFINRNTVIICHEQVSIGRYCQIGWDVVIMDDDHHERSGLGRPRAAVQIGDHVWIGCRALVLKGVTIGDGAVIGAGAIVTRDVPAGALAVGQPARVIRRLTAEDEPAATIPGLEASPEPASS